MPRVQQESEHSDADQHIAWEDRLERLRDPEQIELLHEKPQPGIPGHAYRGIVFGRLPQRVKNTTTTLSINLYVYQHTP